MSDGISPRMTSFRPYLLRSLYAWIADNDMTPHLLVDAARPGVQVPASAVNDGKVVLNVAARAVSGLEMGNDGIAFTARFRGVSHPVWVPMAAVLAIYARETGQLMPLPEEIEDPASAQAESVDAHSGDADGGDDHAPPPRRGNHLRVVK
ncbi:MAG: ClpXP protease specificity-enhancing factor [Lysobacter sp.]|nr:ClpXP protease specificity-enhancing factor [Lysobacter sp.]